MLKPEEQLISGVPEVWRRRLWKMTDTWFWGATAYGSKLPARPLPSACSRGLRLKSQKKAAFCRMA